MSLIIAMSGFAAAMSATPGPVNIISLTSGLNYGVSRTLPFIAGATVGFTCLLAAIGFGLFGLVDAYPAALRILKYLGTAFILYMAVQFIRSGGTIEMKDRARPSFFKGFLLQWLNPKAWLACLAGVSAFTVAGDATTLVLFCGIYFIICFIGIGGWAVLGSLAEQLINSSRQMKIFNICMGILLAVVSVYLFFSDIDAKGA